MNNKYVVDRNNSRPNKDIKKKMIKTSFRKIVKYFDVEINLLADTVSPYMKANTVLKYVNYNQITRRG